MNTAASDWATETEQALLDAALRLAPSHGWTGRMARLAGGAVGLSVGEVELLAPGGPEDLVALLSRRHDARALVKLADVDPQILKIRKRIRVAVEARLDAAFEDAPALGRWTGHLALPQNLALASRLAWESADALWRWAGDTATDENHYSKRILLAGILTGALAVQLSSGKAAAMAFVDRRIGNVMAFEKWKTTTSVRPSRWLAGLARGLGRARYGS